MQNIKGLLFDKDGTLFDFTTTWSSWAAHFFRTLTPDEPSATALAAHLGFEMTSGTFSPDSILIAGTPYDAAQIIARHMPHMTEPQIIEIANDAAENAPQAEVTPLVPFLTDLRTAGYRLGVSTNDAEHLARAHLQSAHADHLFDFIAGYDSGYGPKPDPGMQIGFCNAMNLPAPSVAMIGDSTHDLIAGRKAGMTTIGVLTGPAIAADLAPHADHVLPSIAELPSLLERH